LAEAEETLNAIRNGEVDAIVVSGKNGDNVFSLTSSETPYRIFVEEMNEGASTILANGTILYCNNRFAELMAAPSAKIIGSNFSKFIAENEMPNFEKLLKEGLIFKTSGEIKCLTNDNHLISLSLSFSPLRQDLFGDACMIAADISKLKLKEEELSLAKNTLEQRVIERTNALNDSIAELKKANIDLTFANEKVEEDKQLIINLNANLEQKISERTQELTLALKESSAFSYSVSHDLKAPVRAINGYSHILIDDYGTKLDDEGKRICSNILNASEKMGLLINSLLEFSRISRSGLNRSDINMKKLVISVFNELTDIKSRERIDFSVGEICHIQADPIMIKQVWINLLSNAIKYSSKREKAIISVSSRDEDNKSIFCIKDNGVGFEMKFVDKLFGVFSRLHSETDFNGIGVGLAIVKQIIERHDGAVWAEAEVEKGAAFYFTLPNIKEQKK
jgi:PAS domain S-box-containing protein